MENKLDTILMEELGRFDRNSLDIFCFSRIFNRVRYQSRICCCNWNLLKRSIIVQKNKEYEAQKWKDTEKESKK